MSQTRQQVIHVIDTNDGIKFDDLLASLPTGGLYGVTRGELFRLLNTLLKEGVVEKELIDGVYYYYSTEKL